jgi:hypothetical protein
MHLHTAVATKRILKNYETALRPGWVINIIKVKSYLEDIVGINSMQG